MKSRQAYRMWYAVCFVLLGFIDQRRGSAEGTLQMTVVNLTGVVVGMMLLPSLRREFWRTKMCKIGTLVCIPVAVAGFILGRKVWMYPGQWYTAVLNVVVISYLALYIFWNRREILRGNILCKSCFVMVMVMLVLMQLSVHEVLWPLWFMFLFGCFYLIKIPKEKEELFLQGMLIGIIIWFFVQQILAFGFRPYDYVRYRGLYSGETQNGLFYMIAFCAFTGLWLFLKKKDAVWSRRLLCFLLSAGCVGFQMLTGGRSSLLGIGAAAVLGYMAYDIVMCHSFRHWIVQGMALGVCVIMLFPIVYGCVRYFPTLLHHPVWFEGEYNENTSVHSYDPWNSDKYIPLQTAFRDNFGRILQMAKIIFIGTGDNTEMADGMVADTVKGLGEDGPDALSAEDYEEAGSSPDHPFVFENTDFTSSISIRRTIYYYYASHLNLTGHSRKNAGFYMADGNYYGHAHNMFLQIAYDYGILAGVLFLVWNLWCLIRLLRRKDMTGIVCAVFLSAILVYGCSEMAVTTGQITLALFFIIYYFGMQKIQSTKPENIATVQPTEIE